MMQTGVRYKGRVFRIVFEANDVSQSMDVTEIHEYFSEHLDYELTLESFEGGELNNDEGFMRACLYAIADWNPGDDFDYAKVAGN